MFVAQVFLGAITRPLEGTETLRSLSIGRRRFFQVQADDGTTLHGLLLVPPGAGPGRGDGGKGRVYAYSSGPGG